MLSNTTPITPADPHRSWLHRFAVLTAGVTVGLIVAGATVTSTGSGDAVPDWPLAYGAVFPPMVGGILIEHSHRLIAGVTATLITILAAWLWRKEPRRWVRWLGVGVFFAVLTQALLGGLRVLIVSQDTLQAAALRWTGLAHINPVRIAVAAGHAFLAQIVLCLTFAVATVTSRAWRHSVWGSGARRARAGRWICLSLVLTIFLQLMLGALMRHMGAGLVIPDFPLSFGHWAPPFSHLPHNPNAPFPLTPQELQLQVLVHFSHRIMALLVGVIVTMLALYMRRYYSRERRVVQMTGLIGLLTLLQITLGAMAIWTRKWVPITISHVTIGALLLGSSVILTLWIWRLWPAAKVSAVPFAIGKMEVQPR